MLNVNGIFADLSHNLLKRERQASRMGSLSVSRPSIEGALSWLCPIIGGMAGIFFLCASLGHSDKASVINPQEGLPAKRLDKLFGFLG